MYIFSCEFRTFPVTEGNEIQHIYFQFMTPARKLIHNTKFERFWMQKDMNFGNIIIIHHFGLENPQNPTQKDTNFGNIIIIRHFRPENPQNPTQKDTNFGNTIIIRHFGPENPQNSTQKDTNFEKMHSLTPAKMPTNKESIRFPELRIFRTIIQMHSLTPSNTNQPITFGNT